MFLPSAAPDTPQGLAIQRMNETWGDADVLHRRGRESIGFPVCKKKYAPFTFSVRKGEVIATRMVACKIHQAARLESIQQFGERKGWEPFGQWSLSKAQEVAKQATAELQKQRKRNGKAARKQQTAIDSDDEETSGVVVSPLLCQNGKCMWKMKSAYDDIFYEINGRTESEDEAEKNQQLE